jgi:predicted RNase H-like HicB family nuclease
VIKSAVKKTVPSGVYEIRAQWDSEAGVWVAESEDVPGLIAEADSPNVLVQKLRTLIPELLELNGAPSDFLGVKLFVFRFESLSG